MPNKTVQSIAGSQILERLFLHKTVHVILTVVLYWMAYIFLDNTPSFDPNVPNYAFMAQVMPEQDWGRICLIFALLGTVSAYARRWRIRTIGACLLSFAHAALCVSFWLGKHNAPTVGLLCCFAILGAALAYSTAYIGTRFSDRMETPRF